tara:strand:- start:167 stop:358 length:192 start_codon:yes stop_codon:yes gene_type:complete
MFNSIGDYFAGVKKEMKKVSWLSKNEILGSTFVVGIFSIIVALFLFVVDFGLTEAMSIIMGVK